MDMAERAGRGVRYTRQEDLRLRAQSTWILNQLSQLHMADPSISLLGAVLAKKGGGRLQDCSSRSQAEYGRVWEL